MTGGCAATYDGARSGGLRISEVREALRAARDVVLFLLGAGGIVHETVFTADERPALIVLFAAMVGMTGIFRSTEVSIGRDRREDRDPQ